jgi:nucleotide-binding universal stress UspA family protein
MTAADATTRISIKNILYASDFSRTAENAAAYALELALRFQARIFALHVRPPEIYGMAPPESWAVLRDAAAIQAREEALRLNNLFCGVPHTSLVEEGDVWDVLAAAIEKYSIDLIVMGTHGRRGLQKMILGSVAENVLRRASSPVLTVGPCVELKAQLPAEMKRILFATDFSPASEAAAAYACSLAHENQAALDILHIIEPAKNGDHTPAPEVVSGCAAKICALIPEDLPSRCQANTLIEVGEPAQQILNVATARRSQLIVLGAKTASDLTPAGRLPWAVAHKVISSAPCPVFTVRG